MRKEKEQRNNKSTEQRRQRMAVETTLLERNSIFKGGFGCFGKMGFRENSGKLFSTENIQIAGYLWHFRWNSSHQPLPELKRAKIVVRSLWLVFRLSFEFFCYFCFVSILEKTEDFFAFCLSFAFLILGSDFCFVLFVDFLMVCSLCRIGMVNVAILGG